MLLPWLLQGLSRLGAGLRAKGASESRKGPGSSSSRGWVFGRAIPPHKKAEGSRLAARDARTREGCGVLSAETGGFPTDGVRGPTQPRWGKTGPWGQAGPMQDSRTQGEEGHSQQLGRQGCWGGGGRAGTEQNCLRRG